MRNSTTSAISAHAYRWVGAIAAASLLTIPSICSALDVVSHTLKPSTPGPNQDVVVSLESYTADLGTSHIVWYVDGAPKGEGNGMMKFTAQTKDLGQKTTITAIIITSGGARIDHSIVLLPLYVDLLWQADGYVPPFYKGKALPSSYSKVRFAAFPFSKSGSNDPSAFAYTWYIKRVSKVGDGLGANSVVVAAPRENLSQNVSVDVTGADGEGQGSANLDLKSVSPYLVFYEFAPLLGLRLEQAIKDAWPSEPDQTMIRAVPYNMSTTDIAAGKTRITWTIGGATTANGPDPLEISVGGTSGSRTVGVNLIDLANAFQSARGQFILTSAPSN